MMKPEPEGLIHKCIRRHQPHPRGREGRYPLHAEHNVRIPVVAKALGNRQEETWEIFKSGGVHVVTEAATEKAVEVLHKLVGPDRKSGTGGTKTRAKRV